MELALLVPVKDLTNAKTRLAALLSGEERRELALLMLQGVLAEGEKMAGLARRVVVTSYQPAMELARRRGFEVLAEQRQRSESRSVDWACGVLAAQGLGGVLRVPLDLPLLRAEELGQVLAAALAGHRVVLAPSLDGTGTNALFRSPPGLFPSRFGPGSLARHILLAQQQGVQPALLRLPGLALDVDEPADLNALLRNGQPCAVGDFLRERGLVERLAAAQA